MTKRRRKYDCTFQTVDGSALRDAETRKLLTLEGMFQQNVQHARDTITGEGDIVSVQVVPIQHEGTTVCLMLSVVTEHDDT